jgi:hypothetical protein
MSATGAVDELHTQLRAPLLLITLGGFHNGANDLTHYDVGGGANLSRARGCNHQCQGDCCCRNRAQKNHHHWFGCRPV